MPYTYAGMQRVNWALRLEANVNGAEVWQCMYMYDGICYKRRRINA